MREIARLLLKKRISAVPVVDASGAPIGVISESDLIGKEPQREALRDWWLMLLAEGEALSPDFLASLHSLNPVARVLMSSPVITVGEATDVKEVARILAVHSIDHALVVREGRMLGIVSRADLVRALLAE